MTGRSGRGGRAWRLGALADEAARNVATGGVRTLAIVAAGVVGIVWAAWWDAASVDAARATERELGLRGATTVVVVPAEHDTTGLAAAECAALDHRAGVVAAGPVWQHPGLRTPATGSRRFTTVVATDGAVAALTGGSRPAPEVEAVMAVPLAEELAVRPGAELAVIDAGSAGAVRVGQVVELGRRAVELDAAIALVGWRPEPAAPCWVELHPAVDADVLLSVAGVFSNEWSPRSSYVLAPDPLLRSPALELRDRPSRWAGAAAGAVVALGWVALLWGRRNELGLYRSFRLGWARSAALVWCELALLVAASAAIAALGGVGAGWALGAGLAPWALAQGAAFIGVALATGALGAPAIARISTMDLLKGP